MLARGRGEPVPLVPALRPSREAVVVELRGTPGAGSARPVNNNSDNNNGNFVKRLPCGSKR